MNTNLKISNVTKIYPGCVANDNVSLEFNSGKIYALLGENGAGKSTLVKILSGVIIPDEGEIYLNKNNLKLNSPLDAKKNDIGMVFQHFNLFETLSVFENLIIDSDEQRESLREKIDSIMKKYNFSIDLDIPVLNLSAGQKQKVEIIRCLIRNPKVLILDESSAALDFDSTERLFAKMRSLRDQGAAIFIVTHRIAELVRISDRATVMRDGKDVGVLAGDEITEKNLLRLMTGDKKFSTASENRSTPPLSKTDEIVLSSKNLKVWNDGEEINFELPKGEILGVTGLDGQGQDNFVKALSGIDQPLSGEVIVKQSDEERELTKKEFKKTSNILMLNKKDPI